VEQFYPRSERLASGWMVFTGTRATGGKAHPGRSAGDYELVTLAWPVLLPEDIRFRSQHADTQANRPQWFQNRLVRLVEYGWQQPDGPVLLTQADLALMLGLTERKVSGWLEAARQATGKPLITKGYFFDQGSRPTHKEAVVASYESGLDEAEVARRCQHAPEAVGHYLRATNGSSCSWPTTRPWNRSARCWICSRVWSALMQKWLPSTIPNSCQPPGIFWTRRRTKGDRCH